MDFEMNRDWEDELKRQLQPTIKEFADRNQPKLDSLLRHYEGRPVSEIKPVLSQEMARWGCSPSDDAELTRIATAISEGTRVLLRPGK